MIAIMDKVLGVMMVVTALLSLWAVTTSNHLYVG